MPARAYWKGYLRLSLVTIGIELFSAVDPANEFALHQIHKPSGKRIRYEKVAPGIGPVKAKDIVKGVEVEKGEYVTLDPEELDEIKLESRRTIDLVQFVEHDEIDPRYFERPYYVTPTADDVAAEGFSVIRQALKDAKKVGLGQMATRGRDQICAVRACGDGLLLETLRYATEVRDSDKVFDHIPTIKPEKEMLQLASELIKRKTHKFDPEKFKSHYATALRALINEKRKTGEISHASDEDLHAKGQSNVIDLMSALRASVKGKATATRRSKPHARKASRSSAPRKRTRKTTKHGKDS
ncbi:MAG TPA: Ku protein [Hyphomonadaceae bacterium]|nr:Ku protein [Hyphomonadaceae bacterium]